MKRFPVVEAVSYILAHAPDLVRYGSKPSREIARNRDFLASLREHQRASDQALRYLPNQVFLGGADPDRLRQEERPWWPVRADVTPSEMGRFYSQTSLYGLLKWNDHCNLLHLEKGYCELARQQLKIEADFSDDELRGFEDSLSSSEIRRLAQTEHACPLYGEDRLVGSLQPAHELDFLCLLRSCWKTCVPKQQPLLPFESSCPPPHRSIPTRSIM